MLSRFLVSKVVSQCYNTDQAVSNQYGTKDMTVTESARLTQPMFSDWIISRAIRLPLCGVITDVVSGPHGQCGCLSELQ